MLDSINIEALLNHSPDFTLNFTKQDYNLVSFQLLTLSRCIVHEPRLSISGAKQEENKIKNNGKSPVWRKPYIPLI